MNERRQLLQESLLTIKKLEARLAASERGQHEPIAIIGAGCRYPGGAEQLEDLWRVVRDGVDAITEVPTDRWNADAYYDPDPKASGKMVTKRGGFMRQVDRFDPQVFGISPREAATMDPQQRLLLETSYEALESAGIATDRLVGTSTGVFVGITTSDYGELMRAGGPDHADIYQATGAALNAAAGRVAFTFGFQGPCVSVDTACSSSLVSVHLACQSLRTRESDLALAGGVNVVITPDGTILCSRWGMMAPDGTCKTFSAAADGFVRAEGCAMIALKRLSDALAAGDPILAVIRGTASNSDGKSSGLTVPNGPAQQAVIRRALASAELQANDIDYIEAHGTGTAIGDPIEVEALGALMAQRPADRPLVIGSIKTNIGHTEAASGLAGLLKVVMALRHEAIPPHLHFDQPSPRIPWSELPITVPTKLLPWPRSERPRRAGVSSFGFSGTNAHVILEEAPLLPVTTTTPSSGPVVIPLSARNETALRELAGRYADFLAARPETSVADVAATTALGRAHGLRRAALVAESTADLERDLRLLAKGELPGGAAEATVRAGERPKIAFLFTGQGSQYAGMGRGLYDAEPVFRSVVDRASAILAPYLDRPLVDLLFPADPESKALSETAYTQPALFVLEYALSELWASWGITPSVVIGHSVGEYVAACVAGVFSFEDGLALIAERGRLMQALPSGGAMAAVHLDEAAARARIAASNGRLSIAAVNAPDETVIAGDADALEKIVAECTAEGIKARRLDVSHAFHSHRLDPMLDALARRASSVSHALPRVSLVSNRTGSVWPVGTGPDASYWPRHAREPVRFAAGVEALRAAGITTLLEVGPQATLLALAGRAAPSATWATAASLRKGRSDRREMLVALATLYTRGANVRWDALTTGRRIALPTYPFQRERHWIEAHKPRRVTTGAHPLLGDRQRSPQPGAQFVAEISRDMPAFLADHVVLGTVLLPGTAYVELGLAAARALGTKAEVAVESFVIEAPLALEADAKRLLHVTVETAASGRDRSTFIVRSQPAGDVDAPWIVHARGQLSASPSEAVEIPSVADTRARCTTPIDVSAFYTRMAGMGLEYGPTFRLVRSLEVGGSESTGVIEPPRSSEPWVLHPAILDAAFHLLGAPLLAADSEAHEQVYLPVGIERIHVRRPVPARVQAVARMREAGADTGTRIADLKLEDDAGNVVATIEGLQIRMVKPETLGRALSLGRIAPQSYRVGWVPLATASQEESVDLAKKRIVLLADRGGFAETLARALEEKGAATTIVSPDDSVNAERLSSLVRGDLAWVIDCAALDPAHQRPVDGARSEYLRSLAIARATAAASPRAGLCLVTRGAHAIAAGDDVDLARAPLVGLARTVAAERGDAPAMRIDLDPAAPPDVRAVVSAFELASREPEMGIRSGNVFVPRLEPSAKTSPGRASDQRDVLRVRQRGALDALRIEREVRKAPGPGQIEVDIRAAGLNFRDVLNALGMYPGDAGALGSECSGIVTAVGPDVSDLRVGDEVVGFAVDSFASHALTYASLMVKKPANVGFADAVTLPNTYLTAALAFRAGGLRKGHRVLIHAAAGGVGAAAVRLARRMGAEVIATAGSPEKRAFALAEGASHCFDSRSASFADDIERVTNGEGVDFVLNSLSNELITAGMRVTKPGGSFIEIGKKGIWTPAEAAERAPSVRYQIVDLGEEIAKDIGSVRALFDELLVDVAAGVLAPLPLRAFPLADSVAAFRYMATARHIGKVVLVPEPATATSLSVRSDGTYLVTGGLGGLGFATAEWLAERGAGEIVLAARRKPSAQDEARLEELRRRSGCKVTAVVCDLGDAEAVRTLFGKTLAAHVPLRGIVHTAGVVADAPLADQGAEQFESVARGKVDGAWLLSELSAQMPLDFFVLYSSTSALLGSPGQASYAAGNAFLDGLAAYRRARGKTGTSIAWGAWAEVGMATRLAEAHVRRWTQLGVGMLEPKDALSALERAVLGGDAHVAVAALDPGRVAAKATPAVRALLSVVAPSSAAAPAAKEEVTADAINEVAAIRAASEAEERVTLLRGYVHRAAARVLGFNASALDVETSLAALGFDSLMAVQLKNRVESDLTIEIPLVKFLSSPTVVGLTAEIAERLGSSTSVETSANAEAWEEGSL